MSFSSQLARIVRDLPESLETPGGLFRITYGARNPALGPGLGLHGADDALIQAYVRGLERTQQLFQDWNWVEPPKPSAGRVPVYVLSTRSLGKGDRPLTIAEEIEPDVFASKIALRSSPEDPNPNLRLERAEVEAAHEAAHVFTHAYVSPRDLNLLEQGSGETVGQAWYWFDEATAVFVEGEVCPGAVETRRYGLYWTVCPEHSLVSETFPGGYFAAWFIRYLVQTYGVDLLRRVWAGAKRRYGPLEVLGAELKAQNTTFSEVFWGYCCQGYTGPAYAPGIAQSFGDRGVTESLTAPTGTAATVTLEPLACRYYRIQGRVGVAATPVCVEVEGRGERGEVRAALLTVDATGNLLDLVDLKADEDAPRRLRALANPPTNGGQAVLVVARVACPTADSPMVRVTVTLGAHVPGTLYRSLDLAGVALPVPQGLQDATDYRFEARDGTRMTLLYHPPGETSKPETLAQEYRSRLENFVPATFETATDIPVAEGEVVQVAFTYPGHEGLWREQTAFLRLADDSGLQISVVAPIEHPQAAQWFARAVREARSSLSQPETESSSAIRARGPGEESVSIARPTPGYRPRRIGATVVPVPEGLRGPESYALVSADGLMRFEVPVVDEDVVLRAREDTTAMASSIPVGEITGQHVPELESAFQSKKQEIARALRTALRGG